MQLILIAKEKHVSVCFLQPRKNSCCAENRLASSIHTIYRPVARSRRRNTSSVRRNALVTGGLVVEEPGPAEPLESDEGEDFEDSTPEVASAIAEHNIAFHSPSASHGYLRPPSSRTSSWNTIKLQRRVRLAEKLREVFELPDIEEVCAGMSVIV